MFATLTKRLRNKLDARRLRSTLSKLALLPTSPGADVLVLKPESLLWNGHLGAVKGLLRRFIRVAQRTKWRDTCTPLRIGVAHLRTVNGYAKFPDRIVLDARVFSEGPEELKRVLFHEFCHIIDPLFGGHTKDWVDIMLGLAEALDDAELYKYALVTEDHYRKWKAKYHPAT